MLGSSRQKTAPASRRPFLMRIARFVFLIVSVSICAFAPGLATIANAQVGGSISGTVKDPSGAVVPGVSVIATNTVLGTMSNTVTDGQGLYSFPKLPVARYDVTVQLEGFKP